MKNLYIVILLILWVFGFSLQKAKAQNAASLFKEYNEATVPKEKALKALNIANYYLYKNKDSSAYYATLAEQQIKANSLDSLNFDLEIFKAGQLIEEDKFDEAIRVSKSLQQKTIQDKNSEPYLKAINLQIDVYAKQQKSQVMIDTIVPMLEKIKPINSNTLGKIYTRVGLSYSLTNNPSKALEFYEKSLEIYKITKNQRGLHECYFRIGYNFMHSRKLDEALKFALKAKAINEILNDPLLRQKESTLLGTIYYFQEDYDKAISTFNILLDTKNTNNNSTNYLSIRYIIQSYRKLGQTDKILKFINTQLRDTKTDNYLKYLLYYQLLFTQNSLKDWNESIETAEKIESMINTEKIFNFKLIDSLDFYEQASTSYSGIKDYKKAYEYLKNYKTGYQKYIDNFNSKTTLENQAKFELKEKENQLQQLEILNNKQKLTALESKQRFNLLIIILGFLVVLLVLGTYYLRKIRLKNEEILELNKTQTTLINNLKQSNKTIKKTFSIISHDLRNPFNAILGLSDFVLTHFDTLPIEEVKENLKYIKNASIKNYNLTQRLLSWSARQQAGFVVNKTSQDSLQILKDVINEVQILATTKNIKIHIDGEPHIAFIDENIAKTILYNIFINAIKFTPQNEHIYITIKKIVNNGVCYEILDTGLGLSDEQLTILNNSKSNYDVKSLLKENASGLGINIAKELINIHPGSIKFSSTTTKGALVVISLV